MLLIAPISLLLLVVFSHTLALALQVSGSLKPARAGESLCRRGE
jgi:hypothetical protein